MDNGFPNTISLHVFTFDFVALLNKIGAPNILIKPPYILLSFKDYIFKKNLFLMDADYGQTLSFPICFHGNAENMLCFRELGIDPFMNSNDNISWNRPSPAVWFRCAYGPYQSQLILADKQGTDRSENARWPTQSI